MRAIDRSYLIQRLATSRLRVISRSDNNPSDAVASAVLSGAHRSTGRSECAEDSAHYSARAAHCVCLSLHHAFVRITT